jgi:cell volume regulation protein A
VKHRGRVFTLRPWHRDFGVPELPTELLGTRVARLLRGRPDRPGALVALQDGSYALTGDVLAAGYRDDLCAYVRRRARQSTEPAERAWLRECDRALSAERPRLTAVR